MKTYLYLKLCAFCVLCPLLIMAENIWEDEVTPNSSDGSATPDNYSAEFTGREAIAAEQDATYTIKKGDTLWDLAFTFLGNPFDWQRIWEVNPSVKNPDLIYPGDRLAIPGRTARSSGGDVSLNLIPSETLGALSGDQSSLPEVDYPGDAVLLESIKNRHILSAAQCAEAPYLWTKKDAKGYIYPGNGTVNPPKNSASYQLFSKIQVSLYPDVVYAAGDTVAIFSSLRFVSFNNRTANIVKQSGRAVVKEVVKRKMEVLLIEMSDVIAGDERVAKSEGMVTRTVDTLIVSESAISAEIFTRVEQTVSPYPFQMSILNKGSTHGINVGDVFAVYSSSSAQLSVIGMIINTQEASSTLCMMYMRQNMVDAGDAARLVRRAQLSQQEAAHEDRSYTTDTAATSGLQQE